MYRSSGDVLLTFHVKYPYFGLVQVIFFRKNQTRAEKIIWEKLLRNKQILGYKFLRQKPLLNFIADFYCSKLLLVIEIDGEYHKYQIERDNERTQVLQEYRIKVIRFTNKDILGNLLETRKKIEREIIIREKELNNPLLSHLTG